MSSSVLNSKKCRNDENKGKISPARFAMLVVIAGVLFGSLASVMVRCSTAPSLVLAAYRKVMVTLLLVPPVVLHCREELRSLRRTDILWCALSGLFLSIHFYTYYESIRYTTIAASQVLAGTEVLFVAAILFFSGKERYDRAAAAGIVIALAGGLLTALTPQDTGASGELYGNLCALTCALFSAFYSLIGAKMRKSCSNTLYSFLVYGASGIFLTIFTPLSGYALFGYGAINYAVALGLAVFCSLLSHSLFNWAVKYQSPTLITIFKQLMPLPAALWGFLLFAEVPLWNQIVGGGVMIVGICVYTKAKDG